MRRTVLFTATLGTVLLLGGVTMAQVPGTNLGAPTAQPQPGGSVGTGPGAPTSANRGAVGSSQVEPRGAPPPGAGSAQPGGDPSTSTLAPSGAINPGSSATGGTGGGGSGR